MISSSNSQILQQSIINDNEIIHYPFKVISKIGQGTYGCVYKCLNLEANNFVALKKVIIPKGEEQEGIQSTTLREITVLKKLKDQPGIVELQQVILTKDYKQYLVFEYMDEDLRKHLERSFPLKAQNIQSLIFQIISAVYTCHSNRIFHRDIKPANILINSEGKIKLADFGLAKNLGHPLHRTHTKEVQTLWYRAPEILLGNQCYSPQVDMFSIGCVIGEIITGKVLFRGTSEIDQLFKIFEYMGTPIPKDQPQSRTCHTNGEYEVPQWEGVGYLPHYSLKKFPQFKGKWMTLSYQNIDSHCVDLMHNLLEMDPKKRITAKEALNHPYFDNLSPQMRLEFKNI